MNYFTCSSSFFFFSSSNSIFFRKISSFLYFSSASTSSNFLGLSSLTGNSARFSSETERDWFRRLSSLVLLLILHVHNEVKQKNGVYLPSFATASSSSVTWYRPVVTSSRVSFRSTVTTILLFDFRLWRFFRNHLNAALCCFCRTFAPRTVIPKTDNKPIINNFSQMA